MSQENFAAYVTIACAVYVASCGCFSNEFDIFSVIDVLAGCKKMCWSEWFPTFGILSGGSGKPTRWWPVWCSFGPWFNWMRWPFFRWHDEPEVHMEPWLFSIILTRVWEPIAIVLTYAPALIVASFFIHVANNWTKMLRDMGDFPLTAKSDTIWEKFGKLENVHFYLSKVLEYIVCFKNQIAIRYFSWIVPYCFRYLIWTLGVTLYLSATLCIDYIWNLLARISPLWLEARFHQLKASYLALLRFLGDKVNVTKIECFAHIPK